MGRPSKGDRKQVNVRLPISLISQIDAKRGPISRDEWMARACTLAVRPVILIEDPELRQDMHEHARGRPLRTEFVGDVRVRYYECADCGMEMS